MFGTLHVADDVRKPVPLQFVENRDLSSALSRSSRDRPHVSCEFCRARKVRCSGEPSGCNRCHAVGVQCRYPPREPRRRAAQGDGKMTRESSVQGGGGADDRAARKNGKSQQQPQRDATPVREQEQLLPQYSESTEAGALLSATSPQMLDQEMESDYSYQNHSDGGFDMHLAPACGGEQAAKDGLDEWLDINRILDTPIPLGSGGTSNLGGYFDATMIDPSLMNDNMEPDPASNLSAGALYPLQAPSRPERSGSTASKTSSSSSSHRSRRSTLATTSSSSCAGSSSYNDIPRMQRMRMLDCAQHESHSSVSSSSSSSRTTVSPVSRGSSCSCLQLAACLVEELGAKAAASDRAGMDILLGDFRSALAQCGAILDCERCATARENNMLLAMAAKYMSTICECVAVCYAEMRRTQSGDHNTYSPVGRSARLSSSSISGSRRRGGGGGGRGGGDRGEDDGSGCGGRADHHEGDNGRSDEIRFSTYLIENSHERMQVLGCLVNVQISEFAQMVARLKTRPGVRRGHIMLLTEAGSKVSALQAMLRGGGGGDSSFGSGMHSLY